jgi:Ca2+-binding EF-hand superfamily protein
VLGFGKSISEIAVSEIIKQVDENGDGQISFEEFASMMRKLQGD